MKPLWWFPFRCPAPGEYYPTTNCKDVKHLLRESFLHAEAFDMTMSMLRLKQVEACERRLFNCPEKALFDADATDTDAQALLLASFDNDGGLARRRLLTIGELRAAVLSRLPLESQFLDMDERYLLGLLVSNNGEWLLDDPDRVGAAESLVRRLWCCVRPEDGKWRLHLPSPLLEPLSVALNNFDKSPLWMLLRQFEGAVDSQLYAAGMLHEKQPMALFLSTVIGRDDWLSRDVARRYMKACFDYVVDYNGDLVLLHPGLAEPDAMLRSQLAVGAAAVEEELVRENIAASLYSSSAEERLMQALLHGSVDMMPEERIPHEHMSAALQDAVRPDYRAEECAEDLRLLIKQGYAYEEIYEAMKTMLSTMPTKAMEDALRELYLSTPRWKGLRAARVQ